MYIRGILYDNGHSECMNSTFQTQQKEWAITCPKCRTSAKKINTRPMVYHKEGRASAPKLWPPDLTYKKLQCTSIHMMCRSYTYVQAYVPESLSSTVVLSLSEVSSVTTQVWLPASKDLRPCLLTT